MNGDAELQQRKHIVGVFCFFSNEAFWLSIGPERIVAMYGFDCVVG
jgi:hypothetical protein